MVILPGGRLRMVTVKRTRLMDERHQAWWAERVLVERLSGGDETALVDLYDRYAGFVYGLAVRTLVDRQAAEDITQEVFVSLWEHPERIDSGRGTLRGFLGTVTHRRAVDAVRREEAHRRREARVAREESDVPDVAEAVLRSDTSGRVRTALEVLPEEQRRALELAYFDGYTYRQVAELLAIPEGTAKSRLRLALARIAESLGSEMSREGEPWA
jgi:RNA polymerase sigma-70 factor (ECF subfamily)